MLVYYKLKNYRSIYDEMTLDFRIKSDNIDLTKNPFITKIDNTYISKLLLLYGHNGSGKSNIIASLQYLLWFNIDELFDPYMNEGSKEESLFEIQFYYNTADEASDYKLCTYKLVLDNKLKKIKQELFKQDNDIIFDRDANGKIKKSVVEEFQDASGIGDKVSVFKYMMDMKSEYKEVIKPYFYSRSSLLPSSDFNLKTTNQGAMAHKLIKDFYKNFEPEPDIWNMFKQLIKLADIGIEDIFIETTEMEDSLFLKEYEKTYQEKRKKQTKSEDDEVFMILFKFLQKQEQENFLKGVLFSKRGDWKAEFSKVESNGTKMYALHLLNTVQALYKGCLSIHDEIQGIQSDLIKFMIFLFRTDCFPDIPDTSQLFLSTHDTNLMSTKDININNIWFVNKKDGKSDLYSAAEFETVTVKNVEEKYKTNKLEAKYESLSYALPLRFKSNPVVGEEDE